MLVVSVLSGLLGSAAPAFAAPPPPPAPSPPAANAFSKDKPPASGEGEVKVEPDSPRAALSDFRHLSRQGDFAAAARYLDLSQVDPNDGPQLAQHLREVLNRHLWIDLERVSPESHGNTEDGLPPDREQLGTVPGASGQPEPVLLVRKSSRAESHWLFSAATVAEIDTWYDHLENVWLIDHLPKPLLRMGPRLLRWWQWLALLPMVLAAWSVGFGITRLLRFFTQRALSERYAKMAHSLRGPVTLAWAVAACYVFIPRLGLYQPAQTFVDRWLSAGLLLALFWALWRAVELSRNSVSSSRWAKESLTSHSLLLLGTRLAKFGVAALAFIVVLAELGYHATTVITGLGIGGVALALAAQKTVENLFGAFSLAIDQPFREGDTIQVDGITGTVEAVGLRSTRVRTADRTVISIPNGKLADMRVETISRQDRLRFYAVVGVAHTASAKVTEILSKISAALQNEALVDKSSIGARLIALTDSAMNLEIAAMVDTSDGNQFADLRQRLLLEIMIAVESTGAALAHPTRNVELAPPPAASLAPSSERKSSKSDRNQHEHEPLPWTG